MPVDVEHALALACGATASAVKAKCGSDLLNSPQLQEPSVIKDIAPGPTRAVGTTAAVSQSAHAEVNKPGGQLAGATTTVSQTAHAEVNKPGGQLAGATATVSQSAHAEVSKPCGDQRLDWAATDEGHECGKQLKRLQLSDDQV